MQNCNKSPKVRLHSWSRKSL